MIKHVAVIGIAVGDQVAALDFWVNQVGFEKRRDDPYGEGTRWFQVPPEQITAFPRIRRDAAVIYRDHGVIEGVTDRDAGPTNDAGPLALVEVVRSHDRAHHDEVVARVDAEPRHDPLVAELAILIDVGTIGRGDVAFAAPRRRSTRSSTPT